MRNMSNQLADNLISIPSGVIEQQGGAVVLPLKEYKRLLSYEI